MYIHLRIMMMMSWCKWKGEEATTQIPMDAETSSVHAINIFMLALNILILMIIIIITIIIMIRIIIITDTIVSFIISVMLSIMPDMIMLLFFLLKKSE